MRTLNTPLSAIALSLLLSACTSEGTVTTLDDGPPVIIGLPQVLLNAAVIVQINISPTILLSNGASVTMQRGAGDAWRGTINVAPAAQYTATVLWSEFFAGQSLPLARLQQTLDVTADGTINVTSTGNYSTEINVNATPNFDADGDGTSNFDERENGTDPYTATPVAVQNDSGTNDPETPAPDNSEPEPDASQNPTVGPVEAPTAEPTAEPTSEPTTTTPTTTTPTTTPITPSDTPTTTPAVPSATPQTQLPAPPIIDALPIPESIEVPVTEPESLTPEFPEVPTETTPDPVIAEADTVIPRIATIDAPKIDGNDVTIGSEGQLTGEWAAAVQTDSSGALLLIDNLIIDISAENPDGTPLRRWAAMHDGTHLYLVVIVDDNGDRQRDSLSDLTQDDSLELFLDGDNSKSTRYGADDFHRIFPVRLPGVDKRSATSGDVAGPNSSSAGLIVTFATGPGIGPSGMRRSNWEQDVYELKIDLSSAGIDTNKAFGFELQINDDDGGDARDSKWAWKHPSRGTTDVDATVDDPSTMGTLKLD
jgi:hypothetical protein